MKDNFRTRRKPFTKDYAPYVDYKDLETLSKALSPQGKILSRKRTGANRPVVGDLPARCLGGPE